MTNICRVGRVAEMLPFLYYIGGSICVNDYVIFGRFSYEAGHPKCNPKGLCIAI